MKPSETEGAWLLQVHLELNCQNMLNQCRVKVGAVDAAALGPFKK